MEEPVFTNTRLSKARMNPQSSCFIRRRARHITTHCFPKVGIQAKESWGDCARRCGSSSRRRPLYRISDTRYSISSQRPGKLHQKTGAPAIRRRIENIKSCQEIPACNRTEITPPLLLSGLQPARSYRRQHACFVTLRRVLSGYILRILEPTAESVETYMQAPPTFWDDDPNIFSPMLFN